MANLVSEGKGLLEDALSLTNLTHWPQHCSETRHSDNAGIVAKHIGKNGISVAVVAFHGSFKMHACRGVMPPEPLRHSEHAVRHTDFARCWQALHIG